MSKSFTLNLIIPRITSVTKTEAAVPGKGPSLKRATGKVTTMRSGKRTVIAPARAKSSSRTSFLANIFSAKTVGAFSAVGLASIVLGMGFYVFMINAYASKGYELKQQLSVIQQLNETHKSLVIQQAASGSIVKVNDIASTAGMVPVTGEEFLVANQISQR